MVGVGGNASGPALIRARGLDKSYRRGGEEVHVLRGLSLDVDAGEFVAFISFLFEALCIALVGGVVGCIAVLPVNGITTGTINWQTFCTSPSRFGSHQSRWRWASASPCSWACWAA